MAFFSFNGISGTISRKKGYGSYVIEAENESGDTISRTTNDSLLYDIINSDPNSDEELDKKEETIKSLCKSLKEDSENWKYYARIKCYPTNADLWYGEEHFNINYDLQDPEFFESEKEMKEWITDTLWDIKDNLINYDDICRDLCGHLCYYCK